MQAPALTYPVADRQSIVDELHGHLVADPYRWLEDPASEPTRRWQAEQDELWREHAARLPGRDRLSARIAALADTGTETAPLWRGGRRFFLRHSAGQEHPVLHTARGDGPDEVLLDPVAIDPDGLTTLDSWQPDPGGELLAFQISGRGTEQAVLYVLEIGTGRLLDGPIDGCHYSPVAWVPGGEFYYVRATESGRRRMVYLHRVGTSPDTDTPILGADRDPDTGYGLEISRDGRWLTLAATRGAEPGNDLWLADLAACPASEPELHPVQQDVAASTVCTVGGDGRMYVYTDRDAPRGRLCVGDPARPDTGWRTLVGADAEAVLSTFVILDGLALAAPLLLVGWQRHAISELTVHDLRTGRRIGTVPLPGAGTVGSLSVRRDGSPEDGNPEDGGPEDGGHEAWFSYTDNLTPITVYRYDARTGECAPTNRDPGSVVDVEPVSRQLVCASADGTPVRMVVCAKPGAAGPRPTILYGYGGFGTALTPSFSSYALAWVQAGGVFVTANLRGGGEGGAEWHRSGMLECKQNTFDDFYAVAGRLIADGWTTPAQLGITGESNGGLLVGAAITQRPELFAAAVCSAPVLDMVRYEQSGLGTSWRGEYGSAEDPEALRWLLGYSPYHRVESGVDYPAVLFTVFDADTRVDPLHARKMCAAMQAASTSGRPVLLRREADVGHGDRAVSRSTAMSADMLAFLAVHTGLEGGR